MFGILGVTSQIFKILLMIEFMNLVQFIHLHGNLSYQTWVGNFHLSSSHGIVKLINSKTIFACKNHTYQISPLMVNSSVFWQILYYKYVLSSHHKYPCVIMNAQFVTWFKFISIHHASTSLLHLWCQHPF